jgi:6-phosphogluconolactonase
MFLYAVNEISNFNGGTTGSVSAFAINATNGNLTLLNVVTSARAGPVGSPPVIVFLSL